MDAGWPAEAPVPIYEFECAQCGERFERLVRWGDHERLRCPACTSSRIRKLMSSFSCLGVHLTKRFRREAEEGLKREKRY